ncbi:glycosyltransferase [Curtobacterium sp. RRHDQ10]|uniref:glycosyltransferase n=1 Tax=Curtobacterium phyllosphaerae TaxID=3413379 RepID=UPI003BF03B79
MDIPRSRHAVPPLVSVLVPVARVDDHLFVAIDSLLRQTLRAVEVVVVLDGTGAASDLPDDPRITVHRFPVRRGTPAALNHGLAMARADLIARLDADDVAEPDRLERQVRVLAARPELLGIGSAVALVDDLGRDLGVLDVPLGDDAVRRLLTRNVFVHSTMLVRRSALESVGGYDVRCRRMQDYDLWLRLGMTGPLANMPDRLTKYRVHDGQHSRRTSPFGRSARTVRRSRRRLARHLGEPLLNQLARDAVWTAAQIVRHAGLRAPRYLRR